MITFNISDRLVRALCDTLMHSLWQGALLAAIAARLQPADHSVDRPDYITGIATASPVSSPSTAPQPPFTDRVSTWLNDHHNPIVLVWFLIICARSLQLGAGLYGAYRLKRIRVSPVKERWPERMQQLAGALNIQQTIALLESSLAKTPMMIGCLKPQRGKYGFGGAIFEPGAGISRSRAKIFRR